MTITQENCQKSDQLSKTIPSQIKFPCSIAIRGMTPGFLAFMCSYLCSVQSMYPQHANSSHFTLHSIGLNEMTTINMTHCHACAHYVSSLRRSGKTYVFPAQSGHQTLDDVLDDVLLTASWHCEHSIVLQSLHFRRLRDADCLPHQPHAWLPSFPACEGRVDRREALRRSVSVVFLSNIGASERSANERRFMKSLQQALLVR